MNTPSVIPVTVKARPSEKGGRAGLLRLHHLGNPMKVQIAVQVGKSVKVSMTVVISAQLILTVLALLV
jgi:hypothetical protein